MATDLRKANGVHYTPDSLARFLASVTVANMPEDRGSIRVLDPACGGGSLLAAVAQSVSPGVRRRLVLCGYETDPAGLEEATVRLAQLGVKECLIRDCDFLSLPMAAGARENRQLSLWDDDRDRTSGDLFHVVIANPPYVRTQVLGARRAQALACKFSLSGRVDLYHAFVKAMAGFLMPEGVLGLLTSNRFLTVRSGHAIRHFLETHFHLQAIYDLGDTRLFSAAVLPAIVVARRKPCGPPNECGFDRVYESRESAADNIRSSPTVLGALCDRKVAGLVRTESGVFRIERGVLASSGPGEVWSLSTPAYDRWLRTVRESQMHQFDDVGRVRVGIKTTADEVFVRDDWDGLPQAARPEKSLLRPLLTHHDAGRWRAQSASASSRVLYPYSLDEPKRTPVCLDSYPKARAYLETHRERLTRRRYVLEAGRKWYEIWVPQIPADWANPKIVFPDIAEEPRFFADSSGAIVNGDCYWITLRPGVDPQWLWLILAVANSSFIKKYYDLAFHNKLYAGRRRFMTQYVRRFPLPALRTPIARKLASVAEQLARSAELSPEMESLADRLVWEAFGLGEEIGG